jgi:hypothetical protein
MTLVATMLASATAAADPWSAWPAADEEKCAKEVTKGVPEFVNGSWVTFGKKGAPEAAANASAACKAEVEKRAEACLKDPDQQRKIKELGSAGNRQGLIIQRGGAGGPRLYCADAAWDKLLEQRAKVAAEKAKADAEKKAADERRANAEKAEMPKAAKKDATIEGMVRTAFAKEFTDSKILKIVIVSSEWTNEHDNFNRLIGRNIQVAVVHQKKDICEVHSEAWYQEYKGGRFTGPLSERGAGSLERYEIACKNVK